MSTETAERVGSLLHSSLAEGSKHTSGNVSSVASGSGQGNKQTPVSEMTTKPSSRLELDTVKEKEKLSLQLKESQEKMKVHIRILKFDIRCYCFDVVKLYLLFFFYLFLMSFCWENMFILTVTCVQVSNSLKAMLTFREKHPAFNVKSEFLRAVSENQVR